MAVVAEARPIQARPMDDVTTPSRIRRFWASAPEVPLIALIALGVYLYAGYYLLEVLHFNIGDALARTANAKYLVLSRDPHAAALGVDWMPIPTLAQVPFAYLGEVLGRPTWPGFVSTALFGAGSVHVLGRMGRQLGLPRWTTVLFMLAYAFNPVTVYFAANAMSEMALFFFLVVTFSGFLRFIREYSSRSLIVLALGLLGASLSRYEAVLLIVVIAPAVLAADWLRRGRWDAFTSMILAVGPALWGVFLWFMYMRIITGSFTTFRSGGAETSGGGGTPVYLLDAVNSKSGALAYCINWIIPYFPFLLLLVPLVLVPPVRRSIAGMTLLVASAALIFPTYYLLTINGTYANPRYFASVLVMGVITTMWVASRMPARGLGRLLIDPALVSLVVIAGFTATTALQDKLRTETEGEFRVFQLAQGTYDSSETAGGLLIWGELTSYLDDTLEPGQLVLADARYSFQAALLTEKLNQFIINSDRDYERIVAEPERPDTRIDFAIVPPAEARGGLVGKFDDALRIVSADPTDWREVKDFGIAKVYRFIGPRN